MAVTPDLAWDVLIESGIDPAQLVADMSVAEIKACMRRGGDE